MHINHNQSPRPPSAPPFLARKLSRLGLLLLFAALPLAVRPLAAETSAEAATPSAGVGIESYLVQAEDLISAANAVHAVGGEVTHELGIIGAVAADLTSAQVGSLRSTGDAIRLFDNSGVTTAGKTEKNRKDKGPGHKGPTNKARTRLTRTIPTSSWRTSSNAKGSPGGA